MAFRFFSNCKHTKTTLFHGKIELIPTQPSLFFLSGNPKHAYYFRPPLKDKISVQQINILASPTCVSTL